MAVFLLCLLTLDYDALFSKIMNIMFSGRKIYLQVKIDGLNKEHQNLFCTDCILLKCSSLAIYEK